MHFIGLMETIKDQQKIFSDRLSDLVYQKNRSEGLNKSEIAGALNIPIGALSGYLSGKHMPEFTRMKVIAGYFGVTIGYLLGESEAAAPQKTPQDNSDLDHQDLSEQERRLLSFLRDDSQKEHWKKLIYGILEGAADENDKDEGGSR